MKKSKRDIVERTFGSKKFGYFWVFLGIWMVLDSIRESRSEVWTDPWFWGGLFVILVWGRIGGKLSKRIWEDFLWYTNEGVKKNPDDQNDEN